MLIAKILSVKGFDEAALGLGLAYEKPLSGIEDFIDRMRRIRRLASRSEEKALRFIDAYLDITGPRYWWQEMATYRVGVEVQSGSTMHNILKRPLTMSDFGIEFEVLSGSDLVLERLNFYRDRRDRRSLKLLLPESYRQRRVLKISYQALGAIRRDRLTHPLSEWRDFLEVVDRLPYAKELIVAPESETP